jgi:hypothetical protein
MLLNKKLTLSLSVTNPFKEYLSQSYTTSDKNYIQSSDYRYQTRNARLSITYNFGKMGLEVKKARRGIQNDDLKSGGSSSN